MGKSNRRECGVCGVSCAEQGCRRKRFGGDVLACGDCCFFRDNMTLADFVKKAKKIDRWKKSGQKKSKTGCKLVKSQFQPLSKRVFRMKLRDQKRKCDTSKTLGYWEMREIIEKEKCWFCGACATGVDRKNVGDCYDKRKRKDMVASCAGCNRMCRDKGRNNFVSHMRRVAKRWTPS